MGYRLERECVCNGGELGQVRLSMTERARQVQLRKDIRRKGEGQEGPSVVLHHESCMETLCSDRPWSTGFCNTTMGWCVAVAMMSSVWASQPCSLGSMEQPQAALSCTSPRTDQSRTTGDAVAPHRCFDDAGLLKFNCILYWTFYSVGSTFFVMIP